MGNDLNIYETFHRILESQGISVSAQQVEEVFVRVKAGEGLIFDQLLGKIPPNELYCLWDSMILRALGIEDDGTLAHIIDSEWNTISAPFVYPDVVPFLSFLKKRGIRTGIISNAYQEEIQRILEMVGLDPLEFDIIVGGDTVKRVKPDPLVFQYAVEALEIAPVEALYVGNLMEKDYSAAEKAGLIPFLVLRSPSDDLPEGTKAVTSLEALQDVMRDNL